MTAKMFDGSLIHVSDASFHRNGISGQPFHVAIIEDGHDLDKKLVIMFTNSPGHTAVLSLSKLAGEDIAFTSNSYRGDMYESVLRPELEPVQDLDDIDDV